jgi:hypothetical protein
MRKGIDVGAMTRIERGLSRLAQLTGDVRKVPRKTLGSMRTHCTDDAINARLEQTMEKIELYIQCQRKPLTLERALRRAVAAHRGCR